MRIEQEERDGGTEPEERSETTSRAPRSLMVVLFVALVVGAGLLVRSRADDGVLPRPEGLVVTEVPGSVPPVMAAAEATLAGTARRTPAAPLAPRRLAATAGLGDTFVVWGGVRDDAPVDLVTSDPEVAPLLGDGARYDVAAGAWSMLPASPLDPRAGAVAVAVEGRDEVLVWGGTGPEGPALDGAIWSIADGSWRSVGPAPLTTSIGARVVWTGRQAVVLGGAGPVLADGSRPRRLAPDVAVLDPLTDAWRPAAPLPTELGRIAGAAWDGDDVAVWDGMTLGLYRPSDDAWRVLVPSKVEGYGRAGEIVRAQHVMVAADALPRAGGRPAWGIVWQGSLWGGVRSGPVAPTLRHDLLWSGAAVLAVPRAETGGRAPPPAAFFPFGNRWAALPDDATTRRPGQALAWLDGALVSWGGETGEGAAVDGVVWRPAPAAARELAEP